MRQVVALLTRSLGQREAKRLDTFTVPSKGAQPAGRINRDVILSRASTAVNCEAAWREARRGLIRKQHDPEKWAPVFRKRSCKKVASAGVVQWQNGSFPSCIRGFDSLRPLHSFSRNS